MDKEEQEIRAALTSRPRTVNKDLLSSGSTVLNLGCSNKPNGAFAKGHYYLLVGDSASGKTFIALTTLAEACINPKFKDYDLYYDATEDGALMDIRHFFGAKLEKRLKAPSYVKGKPKHSTTVEEFYYRIEDLSSSGKPPFIYVFDSMDGVTSEADDKHFKKSRKAHEQDKESAGDYGVAKAKANSRFLPRVVARLRETGSILIIISQSRDRIGFGFDPKTRAGGRALRFYATLEMWTSIKGRITKDVKDKKRKMGIWMQVSLKKNRLFGGEATVTIPIYDSYGIDDIGGCIHYLLEEGHWKKSKGIIHAPEFDFTGNQEKLIQKIIQEGLANELRMITSKTWKVIQDSLVVERERRYE